MADVKIVRKKETSIQIEKPIDEQQSFWSLCSITERDTKRVELSLRVETIKHLRGIKILPGYEEAWIRALHDAISETLEELEKILPAE